MSARNHLHRRLLALSIAIISVALTQLPLGSAYSYESAGGSPVYRSPAGVAVSPNGRFALTANEASGTVSLIDLEQSAVVREFPVGERPTRVAFSASGQQVAVTCRYQDEVVILAVPELSTAARIATPNQPYDVVWLDEHRLAVSCTGKDDVVAIVNVSSGRVEQLVPVPQNPKALELLRDGRTLAVACDCYDMTRIVALVSLKPLKVVARIPYSPGEQPGGTTRSRKRCANRHPSCPQAVCPVDAGPAGVGEQQRCVRDFSGQ